MGGERGGHPLFPPIVLVEGGVGRGDGDGIRMSLDEGGRGKRIGESGIGKSREGGGILEGEKRVRIMG